MLKYFRLLFLFTAISYFSPAYADDTKPPVDNTKPPASGETTEQKLAAALRREEELKAELEKHKKPEPKPDPKDDDLVKKLQRDKESADEVARQTKEIERALGFNMSVERFVTDNKDLLPAEIAAIVKKANDERYDNAQAKASAVKSAIIQSYFSVAANLENITPAQKVQLDDYLKLTNTAREKQAADIYQNIFEPALETVRRVKKAEEAGRSRNGFGTPTETNSQYKDRLVSMSRKTHLGEKEAQKA